MMGKGRKTKRVRGGLPLTGVWMLALLWGAAAAEAQTPPPAADPAQDKPADGRLEALERRVHELEENAKDAPGEEKGHWYDRLKILGFTDFTAMGIDRGRFNQDGGDSNGLAVGQLDLFLTARLPENFSFTSEIVFEADTENQLSVDVERILASYRVTDALSISVGRYHTALGYWNQTYHHGRILFATMERPGFYEFEDNGGLLPVHGVGIQFSGLLETSGGLVEYSANVGNGRGREVDEIQMRTDFNRGKEIGANVGFHPDAVPGLIVGGSVAFDTIPPDPAVVGRQETVTETIVGGYVVYRQRAVEFLSEYFRMLHRTQHQGEAGQFNYDLFYAQIAYEIGAWKPYYRYEDVRGPKTHLDPYFGTDVTYYASHLFGVGYRFSALTVVKLEFGFKDSVGGLADQRYVGAQLAIGF